ncbi:fluoride efflux transporter CrcB [Ruegeria sediminis]|uniref:Fluoride-specific ion channel FluC n=1 Tax=Ruegeria sediminis TaxID=2583820 RepID=A0ABY2WT33_9RHOB|nr:fluoride efflux transporter CrcB [Ruegeria sediminis]TMV03285.1 fluoride efflux transporter CrcB [Ruegeria sediminis]
MFSSVLQVALGGAVGATLRYLTGMGVFRVLGPQDFPVAIILVNVVGSFLMGIFVVAAAHRELHHLSPLVVTGLMGGFTTFSAFSLEAVTLYERGAVGYAALYVGLSVGLSLAALAAGLFVARGIWA